MSKTLYDKCSAPVTCNATHLTLYEAALCQENSTTNALLPSPATLQLTIYEATLCQEHSTTNALLPSPATLQLTIYEAALCQEHSTKNAKTQGRLLHILPANRPPPVANPGGLAVEEGEQGKGAGSSFKTEREQQRNNDAGEKCVFRIREGAGSSFKTE